MPRPSTIRAGLLEGALDGRATRHLADAGVAVGVLEDHQVSGEERSVRAAQVQQHVVVSGDRDHPHLRDDRDATRKAPRRLMASAYERLLMRSNTEIAWIDPPNASASWRGESLRKPLVAVRDGPQHPAYLVPHAAQRLHDLAFALGRQPRDRNGCADRVLGGTGIPQCDGETPQTGGVLLVVAA